MFETVAYNTLSAENVEQFQWVLQSMIDNFANKLKVFNASIRIVSI